MSGMASSTLVVLYYDDQMSGVDLDNLYMFLAGGVGRSWLSSEGNSSFCCSGGPSTAPHDHTD